MPYTKTVFNTTNTGAGTNFNVNGDYIISNVYQVPDEKQKDVYGWLAAPDSSVNYHAAQEKHHADTCSWFIKGKQFLDWKEAPDSALWVYGTPGCGKTIICSTAVDEVLGHCAANGNSAHACAYFFFDNRSGQNDLSLHHKLIRSLIRQLSHQSGGIPESLMEIYGGGHQQPSIGSLQLTLRRIIEGFEHVYIIIDALDECTERKKVLAWIEDLMQWHSGKLGILLSSRPEEDIKGKLDVLSNVVRVSLTSSVVNEDIKTYVHAMLLEMIRWDEKTRAHVEEVLIEGADGMFRWVALQILELSKCRSRRAVDAQLQTLPKDLDATYEKMLESSANPQDLKHILLWLAFSQRDLQAEVLEDVIAVDFLSTEGPLFDPGLRYFGTTDVLDMCSGFIAEHEYYPGSLKYITLAHMSVKDYLISERIKSGAASYFSINEMLSHLTIAQACLACLLHLGTFSSMEEPTAQPLPLARYAARSWIAHMRLGSAVDDEHVSCMVDRLFSPEGNALINLVRLNDPDKNNFSYQNNFVIEDDSDEDKFSDEEDPETAPHLYYASSYGLEIPVKRLLNIGVDIAARGGKYGNALQAASYHGHGRVVKSLLDHGADVNTQGGEFVSALYAASYNGSVEIVQLLLDRGADVTAQGGVYGNALQCAADRGHVEVIKLLLDRGADVNVQAGHDGNALQAAAASYNGNIEVIQLLLDRGADVNAQVGFSGNPLQSAAYEGHIEVVQLLLDHGANVHAQGGDLCNALQAAVSYKCNVEVVQLLLDRGADVNVQGGYFGNALQSAAHRGHVEVVQLLLDCGADINAQGGESDNALQSAACRGHVKVVHLLLDRGADVNAQGGGEDVSALYAASHKGNVEVVQLLLDRGADVNAQAGGDYVGALYVASYKGNVEVVQLLLDHAADVNAQGGEYGYALQSAAYRGHVEVIQLLLDHGADVNAQGGESYGNALQAAAAHEGNVKVVQLLLDRGADVNVQGGQFGNALQSAAHHDHVRVVQLLLDHDADVNAQGGYYGNALQAAAASGTGDLEVVQLLLEHGADVNAQGGEYGNALQAAAISLETNVEVVQLLLARGADVNAQGGIYGNALQAAAASWEANDEVVQLLLDSGADVNIQGGQFGNALQAASNSGGVQVVQLLLDRGADVNIQGGQYGNALAAASAICNTNAVQLLLLKGADVQAQGGRALRFARGSQRGLGSDSDGDEISQEDRHATVQLLLDGGAIAEEGDGISNTEEAEEDTGSEMNEDEEDTVRRPRKRMRMNNSYTGTGREEEEEDAVRKPRKRTRMTNSYTAEE